MKENHWEPNKNSKTELKTFIETLITISSTDNLKSVKEIINKELKKRGEI